MQAVAGEQNRLENFFNLQAITDMHDHHVQEQYERMSDKSDYADPAEDKHLRTEKEYQKYLPQYAPEVDSRIVGLGTKELKDIIERAGKLDLTFAADDGLLDKYAISEKTQGRYRSWFHDFENATPKSKGPYWLQNESISPFLQRYKNRITQIGSAFNAYDFANLQKQLGGESPSRNYHPMRRKLGERSTGPIHRLLFGSAGVSPGAPGIHIHRALMSRAHSEGGPPGGWSGDLGDRT